MNLTPIDHPVIQKMLSLSNNDLKEMTKNELLGLDFGDIPPSWTKTEILEEIQERHCIALKYIEDNQNILIGFHEGQLCKFKKEKNIFIVVRFDVKFSPPKDFNVLFVMQKLEIKLSDVCNSNDKDLFCPTSSYAFGEWIEPINDKAVLRSGCTLNLLKAINQIS